MTTIKPTLWIPLFSLPLLLIAAALVACDSLVPGVPGSGHATTETRQIAAFSKIKIEDSAEVEVAVNPVTALTVTSDDNLLPLIQTTVNGDTLTIRSTQTIRSSLGIKIRVTTPSLQALSIAGSGDVHAEGIKTGDFAIDISGSGAVTLKGAAATCSMAVSGSGDIQAAELLTHEAQVTISGSGSITVYADHSLDASIAGTGAISYLGHPGAVKKSIAGVGSIEPH